MKLARYSMGIGDRFGRQGRAQLAAFVDFRQLLHVGYKVAAEMGARYFAVLRHDEDIVAANVTQNIFERHMKPIFLAGH